MAFTSSRFLSKTCSLTCNVWSGSTLASTCRTCRKSGWAQRGVCARPHLGRSRMQSITEWMKKCYSGLQLLRSHSGGRLLRVTVLGIRSRNCWHEYCERQEKGCEPSLVWARGWRSSCEEATLQSWFGSGCARMRNTDSKTSTWSHAQQVVSH